MLSEMISHAIKTTTAAAKITAIILLAIFLLGYGETILG